MIWIDLIYNLALLVALSVVSGFVDTRWKRNAWQGVLLQGVVFGGAAAIGMLRPFVLSPGLIFDGRSVMISLGGLFFGPWTAAVACLMTIPLRVMQGGAGTVMGVSVILVSAVIGAGFHLHRRRKSPEVPTPTLLLFGVAVHLAMLVMTVALPPDMILPTLKRIAWPVVLVFPLATVLIGKVLSDQAARAQFLAASQESERRFRAIFNSTFQFTGLLTPDGIMSEANQAALDFAGIKVEDVVHRPFWEARWWRGNDARVRQLREAITRAAAGEFVRYEVELQGAGQATAIVDFSLKPIFDRAGRVTLIIPEGRDITERKRAEEALRESEEKFRSLYASMTEGVVLHELVCDASGKPVDYVLLDVNPAFESITGLARSAVVGRRASEVYRTSEAPYLDLYADVATTGRSVSFQTTFEPMKRVFSISAFSPSKGRFATVFGDITEQRRLLEQLLQSQKMEAIGLLAGGIAHDFRNQLTVIKGYAEILIRGGMPEHEALDCMHQILTAADRSADLSGQLLAFSRQQELRPTVVNLDSVIAGLSKSLSRMVGEDVRLSVAPCANLGNVKTDVGQFQQALVNLVVNARDAMPQGGQLTIETGNVDADESFAKQHSGIQPGPYVMTAVSDTGVGMDTATIQHIFEPFFTTKPVGQGTGLGLSMVYGFVRQSGGHVSAYSEPGLGSTFKIYLPRVQEELADEAQAGKQPALPTGTGTILVVEDEDAIRAIVAQTLRKCGYTVLEASGAKDALPLGEHYDGKIDLLISDVVMPGMSGPDIAAKVLAARPGLPVLYISGHTGKTLANRGVLPSDVNLLVKPFSSHLLVAAVIRLLGQNT